MRPRWLCCLAVLCVVALARGAVSPSAGPHAHDWPDWLGPHRDDRCRETGLLRQWPTNGPPLVWKAKDLGTGYSTPSISAGRIFGLSWRGQDEVVWALDEATGKELWHRRIAAAKPAPGGEAREGSRGSAAVVGDRLYAIGQNGDVVCLEAATGAVNWHKNLVKDFGGAVPTWGYSETPLVDGDKVICTPGGQKATLVAFDRQTGNTVWEAQVPQGDRAAYASAVVAVIAGQRQYVQFLAGGVVGVAAETGKFLWRYDAPHNGVANCTTPVVSGEYVFACSDYGVGGGLVKIVRDGETFKAEQVYFTKQMQNKHDGVVLVDGYLYGANGGRLNCLRFLDGKRAVWSSTRPGKGSILYADGRLYYRSEHGPMYLVEANPRRYVQRGMFNPPDQSGKPTWPYPVIANGKLYLRDQNVLLCYDVRQHHAARARTGR